MSSEATQNVTIFEVLAWLESNKKAIIIACVAAVVIGFGVAIYRWKSDQTELAASDALLKLKAALSGNDITNPPPASDFTKVAQEFPGTSAGERALLLAAGTLFTENKFAEARNEFSKFVQDRPQSPFAATAAYGVACCLEAEHKQDEALAAYQNLSVRYPNSGVLDDAKLATARIYEAKKQPELALRIYDELTKAANLSNSGTAGSEALIRREDLLAHNPGLAKTNAPAVALPSPTTNIVQKSGTNASAVKH